MKNKQHRVIQLSCVKLIKQPHKINFIVDDDFNEKDFDWDRIIRFESDSPQFEQRSRNCNLTFTTCEEDYRKQYSSGYEEVSVKEIGKQIDYETHWLGGVKLKLEKDGNILGVIYKTYKRYIDGICNHHKYVEGYKGFVEWYTGEEDEGNKLEKYLKGTE